MNLDTKGVFVLVLRCRLFVTFITEDIEYKKLCTKDLEKPEIDKWADAVQRDFFVSTNIVHDLHMHSFRVYGPQRKQSRRAPHLNTRISPWPAVVM